MKNINRNYYIGNCVAERKGGIMYEIIKNYMNDVIAEINGNKDNAREVINHGINNNMLFMGMREKKSGKIKVYTYQFSIDKDTISVRIKNSERDDVTGFNIPKKILKLYIRIFKHNCRGIFCRKTYEYLY